jgi:membrane-bound serine protease (ClpP class)
LELTPYLVTLGLFLLGLLCVAVEVFVIPGFGFIGVAGGGVLLASVVYSWLTIGPVAGIVVLVLSAALTGGAIWAMMFTRMGRRFRLGGDLKDSRSAVSVGRDALVGREAVTATYMRPSGVIVVDDERLDATTSGEYIEQGARVRISAVEGPRIIVEPFEDPER